MSIFSQDLTVDFEHWCVPLDEDSLQYGSPHFGEKRARDSLLEVCKSKASRRTTLPNMAFCRDQIYLANEVFPEAAVADPLADLEVLDEWRSGIRVFPYPGQYSRLELFEQEGKGTSTSSTGVIGEIMAGMFAQDGISPWVIVRVIGNWPDFIFYNPKEKRYSFVEAKAFIGKPTSNPEFPLLERVTQNLLRECVLNAVHQINVDPWVTVWGAFTAITEIKPFRLMVTFVEFDCPDRRKNSVNGRHIPNAVATGIAKQAVVLGVQDLQEQLLLAGGSEKKEDKNSRPSNSDVTSQIITSAEKHIEELLKKAAPEDAINGSKEKEKISSEIKNITEKIPRKRNDKSDDQRPFYEGRRFAAQGKTATVRDIRQGTIYMKNLSGEEIDALDHDWKPDWNRASQTHTGKNHVKKWRFGGGLYWIQSSISGTQNENT